MKIELTNIQSWKDGILNLPNGFVTMPIAQNNYGKSVPVKALMYALIGDYCGSGTSSHIIRDGCVSGRIVISEFDNDKVYIAELIGQLIIHKMYNENTKDFDVITVKPAPEEVFNYLGFNKCSPPIIDPSYKSYFIETTNVENFEYCSPVLQNVELEKLIEELQECMRTSNQKVIQTKAALREVSYNYHRIPNNDISEVKEVYETLSNYLHYIKAHKEIVKTCKSAVEHSSNFEMLENILNKSYLPPIFIDILDAVEASSVYHEVADKLQTFQDINIITMIFDTCMLCSKEQNEVKKFSMQTDLTSMIFSFNAVVNTVKYLTEEKNLDILYNKLNDKQKALDNAIMQLKEEERKFYCPQCGFDLRTRKEP